MCGRFVSARKRAELLKEFAVQRDAVPAERAADYADYNVAPTKRIYAVMEHKEERELRLLRWGLVPFWAKDAKGGSRLINARVRDGRGQALLPRRLRQAPLPDPGRRLLRVADRPGQGQAAVLHLPDGRRHPRLRRPVRAVAEPGGS